jgi:hypothetical protein
MYGIEESVWLFASSLFESASSSSIFTGNRGVSAFVEEFSEKMNVRPELKEAVLLQRMKFWLLRARYGPIGNCSKSRGKKNFWALVRRHRALAERYGLRETDVF